MNILLLSASPHKEKSRTFMLAQEVMKGIGSSAKTEVIQLSDKKIGFCKDCQHCHKKMLQCPIKDDASSILHKMLVADGILLVSPNYINQVTAMMKALFDRTSHFIHCKRLEGKYIAGVVTSGSGQDKEVLDYIAHYSNACGAQYSGGVSSQANINEEKKSEAFNLGKAFVETIQNKKTFPEQAKILEIGKERFKQLCKIRKDEWSEEYQYWNDKN